MWYEWAVVWRRGVDEHSSAHECAVLKQAVAALPDCVMLAFALADALEATGKHADALKVFEVCCSCIEAQQLSSQVMELQITYMCSMRCGYTRPGGDMLFGPAT